MPIDIIVLLVAVFGFWQGYQRGIIEVAFNVISYVFGVTLAFKMSPVMTSMLEKAFNSTNPLMFLAGFLVNLAIVMIVVRYAAKGLESIFQAAYMGTINQILGGAVYGLFSVLFFSIILWFADQAMMVEDNTKATSRTYPIVIQLPGKAKEFVIRFQPVFTEIWGTSITWMDKMKDYGPRKTESKAKYYDIEEDKKSKEATSGGIDDFPEDVKPRQKTTPRAPVDDGDGIEE
jgi:membrane protein required for colicin V production